MSVINIKHKTCDEKLTNTIQLRVERKNINTTSLKGLANINNKQIKHIHNFIN